MRKIRILFALIVFASDSFAQTADDVAISDVVLPLQDLSILFPIIKSDETKELLRSVSAVSLKNGIAAVKAKQKLILVAFEKTNEAPVRLDLDLSSMNASESVIGLVYPLEKFVLGLSAETVYIVDWKEAQLDERTGFKNKAFPLKQVQYTPLHPRIFKLSISFNF